MSNVYNRLDFKTPLEAMRYNGKTQLLGREVSASMKDRNHPPFTADLTELEWEAESLRCDNRKLKLENDLLKKANEPPKKVLGVDRQLLIINFRLAAKGW